MFYLKQFIYLLVIIPFLLYSCKKERLKGDEKELAGEWELTKSIQTITQGICNQYDITNDFCNIKSITFKKNGRIILSNSIEEKKYSLLSSGPSIESFGTYLALGCPSGYKDSISEYKRMLPQIYFGEFDETTEPYFYFKNSILVIESNHANILGNKDSGSRGSTFHFFKKVSK